MMVNMAEVDKKLIEEGIEDYKIVSFSVDPDFDTPEVFKNTLICLMSKIKANGKCWLVIHKKKLQNFAAKSFKTLVADYPDSDQVMHASYFST